MAESEDAVEESEVSLGPLLCTNGNGLGVTAGLDPTMLGVFRHM